MSKTFEIQFFSVTTVVVTNADEADSARDFAIEEIGFDIRRNLVETKTRELPEGEQVERAIRHADHHVDAADYA